MPGSLPFYQLGYQMLHGLNSDILIILLFHIPIFIAPLVKVLEIHPSYSLQIFTIHNGFLQVFLRERLM